MVDTKTNKQGIKVGKGDTKINKENITTIKIKKQTKARLEHLKEHERETYEEVIRKILYILNRIRKDPVSANRLLSRIDNGH